MDAEDSLNAEKVEHQESGAQHRAIWEHRAQHREIWEKAEEGMDISYLLSSKEKELWITTSNGDVE